MRRDQDNLPTRSGWGGGSPLRERDAASAWYDASPWQMMRRMQEDMDRVFGQFLGGQSQGETGNRTSWAPSVDVTESDREWCIEAELPGVNKDQIEVHVQNHQLVLRAEMREQREEQPDGDQRRYHYRERRYGSFQRVFPLPEAITEEDISCEFRNGVLTVHVPKRERTQPQGRRVPIQDVDQLPSETAGGRMRSPEELLMTGGPEITRREAELAGAKGGEASSSAPQETTHSAPTSKKDAKQR
jgi:HSP20 family protein